MTHDYAGRRVLVTGHTGFKGSWLGAWLERLGAQVCGLALPPDTTPSLYLAAGLDDNVRGEIGDIRDAATVDAAIRTQRPEIIFHLAAQSLVRRSYADPIGTYATNVMGTAHVLAAAQRHGVRAVVVITSDKCYAPPPPAAGYRETDPLGGHDPYSASKACAELVTASWRDSFGAASDAPLIASARAGNVIGGGDWAQDRLIPDLIRAACAGQPALIRNPQATRPWQHVLEPLAGYLALGARLLAGDKTVARAWNFGPEPDDMRPVAELCNLICTQLGARWTHDASEHPNEAAVLRLDSRDAHQHLHWTPRWRLADAAAAVGQWHQRFAAGESARALMHEQIAAYTGDAEVRA